MTEQDLIIQDLRRAKSQLNSELAWADQELSRLRQRGKWITHETVIQCSVCGISRSTYWNEKFMHYCPNCGARMEDEV